MRLKARWSRRFSLFAAISLALPFLNAQVAQVREYNLHAQRDRNTVFAVAVTPEQDVLSFAARNDGRWLLTRVRNWLDKTPSEQAIDVPAWSRDDLAAAFGPVLLDLFVTLDGRFAISVASAKWGRDQKVSWDSLISVVDLKRFEVATTTHAPADPSVARTFYLDRAQHLAAASGETNQRLLLLDVPSLAVAGDDNPDNKPSARGTGKTIGTIRETANSKVASLNGRDFLLVVEGGTKLKVFELKK